MPPRDTHLKQAQHNEDFIAHLQRGNGASEFTDWAVTAAFYAAVHYVEAVLAEKERDPARQHSTDHAFRNEILKRTKSYEHLWKYYWPLYNASIYARYLSDGQRDLNDFRDYMPPEDVERFINSNLTQVRKACLRHCGLA